MTSKISKILLSSVLLASMLSPSVSALAVEKPPVKTESKEEGKPEKEKEEKEDSKKTGEEEDKVVGMSLDKAEELHSEIMKVLKDIGGTGEPITIQFADDKSVKENTKLYNELLTTQLKLYELTYKTTIASKLDSPVKANIVEDGKELKDLRDYLIALNVLNNFLDTQIKTLKKDKQSADLIEALELLKIDNSIYTDSKITSKSPLPTQKLQEGLKSAIEKRTSQSIAAYFKYLNGGDGPDKLKKATGSDNKEYTSSLLAILKQWDKLPHIEDATDSMRLLGLNQNNQEWLEALKELGDKSEEDTGGDTEAPTDTSNTAPELATSALGRLGSSLFTVKRSQNADDTLSKPITNTLGWTVDEEGKSDTEKKVDPGPLAKDDFLAMFAATSIYRPFISKVGDKDYLEAYKSLFKDSPDPLKDDDPLLVYPNNALGPLDILNQVQNLKKPLYYYNDLDALGPKTLFGNSTKSVKGTAELLTVSALIDAIKNKGEIAAITMHGVMEKDGDSFAFYNYSLNKDGQVETSAAPTEDAAPEEETSEDSGGETGEETPTDNNVATANTNTAAGAPILNKVPADKTVNGGQDSTRVVLEMTFNQKNPGSALLTGALMHNIYNDTLLKSKFKSRASESVYIDAIGNIVLNDGLIVLPASANPTYWTMPDKDDTKFWKYNPFTVAFMDTYPAIYQGGSAPSSVNNKKDKNKYLISSFPERTGKFAVRPLAQAFDSTFLESESGMLYDKFKVDGTEKTQDDIVRPLENSIGVDKDKDKASDSWYKAGQPYPIQLRNLVTTTGDSIFPYIASTKTDPLAKDAFDSVTYSYKPAILIAKNMYAYLIDSKEGNVKAADGKSPGGSSAGRLRQGYMFNNVTMPILTGVTSGIEFDKTNAKSNLLTAGGDTNVFQKWLIQAANWVTMTSKNAKNILSIASPDDISLLKLLYGAFIDYGYYIIFVLLVFIIIIYVRMNDFMAASIKAGVIIVLLFTSLFLVPLLVPWTVGKTTAPMTKTTVLNSLMTKLEIVDKVNTAEVAGTSGLSLKMYNLSPKQAKEINEKYKVDSTNYLTNQFSINNNLGMYVKGTEVRLDLYSFWRFDPLIVATKENVTDPNPGTDMPQVYHSSHSTSKFMTGNETAKKDMAYNNEILDYYMPFNLLQDGFMTTINKYLTYYNPPQSIVRYPDGLVKSSYIMNTYMKSLAFLSAEPNISELISTSTKEENYSHRGITKPEVDIINSKFYPYGDIMNLQPFVDMEWKDLKLNYANSLWAQTMLKAGYYSPGTGKDKRLKLANKVNRAAYDTMLQMKETKGLVSDETLMKLVALYTTFEWNKEISFASHNMYPKYPSISEISAEDILVSTVLGQSKQFQFYDTNLVNTINEEKGIIGVLTVTVATLALVAYSILLSWIMPMIIIGLLFYSIFLVLTNRNIMPALTFVFRLTVLMLVMNLLLVACIITYDWHDSLLVLTSELLVVSILFIFLLWKQTFKKPVNRELNWQEKHVRGQGGSVNDVSQQLQMQSYLEESSGLKGNINRSSSQRDRY